jgi:hypothetical protein
MKEGHLIRLRRLQIPCKINCFSSYHLCPRKSNLEDEGGGIKGGLGLMHSKPDLVGRKSYISKEKLKASKEVKAGKQLTIQGALRAENPRKVAPS